MSRVEQLASQLQIQRIDKASLDPDRSIGSSRSSHDNCANVVLEMAKRRRADLVICRASDRKLLLERIAPSCAVRISAGSDTPVLLVKEKPLEDYRTVVVATDFSHASMCGVRSAAVLAPNAHFIFVHAYRLPDERLMRELEVHPRIISMYREQGRVAMQRRLDALLAHFADSIGSATCALRYGSPHAAVDAVARQNDADLIVVGRNAKRPMGWLGFGSCFFSIINKSHCDVLIGTGRETEHSGRRQAYGRLSAAQEWSAS